MNGDKAFYFKIQINNFTVSTSKQQQAGKGPEAGNRVQTVVEIWADRLRVHINQKIFVSPASELASCKEVFPLHCRVVLLKGDFWGLRQS